MHDLHISWRRVSSFFKELCPPRGGGGDEGVEEEEEIGKLFLPPPFLRRGWGEKARRCKKRPLLLLLLSPVSQRQKMGGGGGGRSMRFLRRIGASEAKGSREVPPSPLYIHLRKAKKMSLPKTRSGTEFRQPFFPAAFLSLFIETSAAAPIFSCKLECFLNGFIGSTI